MQIPKNTDRMLVLIPRFFMWVPFKGQQDTQTENGEQRESQDTDTDTDTDTESELAYLAIDLRTNGGR